MDIEKINNLFKSLVPEDAIIAVRILDSLPKETFAEFRNKYMSNKSRVRTGPWHHTDYVLEYPQKNTMLYEDYVYFKGKHGYYFLASHAFAIDSPENVKYWTENREETQKFTIKQMEEL